MRKKHSEKNVGTGENVFNLHFSTIISTIPKRNSNFRVIIILLSAKDFRLGWSKILSCGKEFQILMRFQVTSFSVMSIVHVFLIKLLHRILLPSYFNQRYFFYYQHQNRYSFYHAFAIIVYTYGYITLHLLNSCK